MTQNRMAGNLLRNKAFEFKDGKLVPTAHTEKLMSAGREWNPELEVVPYNSVEAQGGVPMWGSGGGHYNANVDPNKVYVDPIQGDSHVVAHEIGHAVAPSEIRRHQGSSYEEMDKKYNPETNSQHPVHAPDKSGARVRADYEMLAKPVMIEEASAQGFAVGLQRRAGPTNNDYNSMYDYPKSFHDRGANTYERMQARGRELTDSENNEIDAINRSHMPAIKREYDKGYERGLYGPNR